MAFALVMTTTNNDREAETIARNLLAARLAACVQVMPIKSYYTWAGKFTQDNEYLLLIKGKQENFERIRDCITSYHSYEVPEIIQVPIETGSAAYLEWMAASSL